MRQTDADGKTILGPIDPLDPIRASIEDLRDNVDDRIYYFGSKDLVTTDLDPVTNTAIQLSRIDGDGVAEVGVVLERDWRPTIIAGDAYAFDKNGARVRLTASADVVRCEVRNATAEFDRITAAGVFSRTRTKLYGSSNHLLSTTKLFHRAGLGQSLSVGNSGTPLFTTAPVRPGRVLSFNAGVLTYGSDHNSLYSQGRCSERPGAARQHREPDRLPRTVQRNLHVERGRVPDTYRIAPERRGGA